MGMQRDGDALNCTDVDVQPYTAFLTPCPAQLQSAAEPCTSKRFEKQRLQKRTRILYYSTTLNYIELDYIILYYSIC